MKKVKLGEVCEIRIGKTPNRSQTLYWGGDYPWLSISDMKGKILCTTKEKITQEAVQKEKMQIVSKGTVVMSFKLSIGKVGILAENMYTNEAIANFVVKNNKMLFNEYLYYALQGMNFDSLTDRAVMGKTLNKAKLNNLSIVYNEPFMQQQIVLRLDGVNKLIESRKQQLSELSKLVKSRFNEIFGDPVLNEMGWEKHALKEFGIWKSGGTPKRNEEKYFRGRIPWITSGELEHKYIDDSFEKITEKAIESSSAKIIEKGSLLLGMYDTAGLKSSINTKVMSCNQAIAFAKLDDKITNTIYVYYVIQNLRSMLLNQQRGVRQKNFNLSMIKNISIPLPPLSLQNEFADFVTQVDKSQLAIQKSLEELETLK
ncbi:restriction endonuclease subunit S, partial [uncultured Streptococcus sp.]|uniref:restriction endonuclease subunit S n=1 Tax=uncultured Streptococcus sp. TaxID=83427 RepID=UPI0028896305